MLGVDYGFDQHQHKYASSTMSSDTLSGSCDSRNNRIRTVRLVRPSHWNVPPPSFLCRHGPSLGFSLRGGREHGTGFFVSNIEPGSEAHRQGLKVGDQIIRVNGFTIEDAVHKEVLQLISNHTHLTLKVRGVGMIPVKDSRTDTLSWQIISDASSLRSSPPLSDNVRDVRINIIVAPKSKLGCGICKGPEWKPGIFIQFTKEGGIAREAGLRPGDQILYCNNVDFSDISFKEAVNLMKSSRQLDIIVRKSAGSELFPGESSGYNSSASSVTGDQSPSWSDSKRLSIVKEENLDLEDRLSQLDRLKRISSTNKLDTIEWEEPEPEPNKQFFKPTIINLSENGTTIKNNGTEEDMEDMTMNNVNDDNNAGTKLADMCMGTQQHEMKTVVVEVHRSDIEEKLQNEENKDLGGAGLVKSASTSSFGSLASRSSNASSSLSSAISQEIQRRMQKNNDNKPSIDEQLQIKKILKGVSNEKQHQHIKLMDEFKKAHQKMFKAPDSSNSKSDSAINSNGGNKKPTTNTSNNSTSENADRLAGIELSQKLSERLITLSMNDNPKDNHQANPTMGVPPPPPPPPNMDDPQLDSLASSRSSTLKPNKTKSKAPPVPVKYSTLSFNKPPPCPTPDYDTLSLSSTTSHITPPTTMKNPSQNQLAHNNNNNNHHHNDIETIDMDSIESYKMNNPSNIRPLPPNTYFKKTLAGTLSNGSTVSNGSNGTNRKDRPVSITIGEYPTLRKQPGKLDFLQSRSGEDGYNGNGCNGTPISSQLASELAQTLNRSHLRKRTESMENLLCSSSNNYIKPQSNGSIRISLNSHLARNLAKSTNDLSNIGECSPRPMSNNRVTINVNNLNNNNMDKTHCGILKNNSNSSYTSNHHRPLVQQKSITFGELPTVIKDQPLRVT